MLRLISGVAQRLPDVCTMVKNSKIAYYDIYVLSTFEGVLLDTTALLNFLISNNHL